IHMGWNMVGIGIANASSYLAQPYSFMRGQRYHIAMVMDASSTEFYINGESIGSVGAGFSASVENVALKIGASETAASSAYSGEFFTGEIDEVRIWNTKRTSVEIQENMNASVAQASAGLIAYYPIDAGVTDESNKVD